MTVDLETVVLQPLHLLMVQKKDMTLFRIIDSSITAIKKQRPQEGIKITIVMKRKVTSEMMSTYFPSLLLMLITFATTFFKPFFFEAALSVNLTTMLVMTTIFISKMEGLPPTSDTKMIDYWLILCQLVPFVTVVLITAMEYLREEDIDDDAVTGSHTKVLNIVQVSMYEGTTGQEETKPDDDESPKKVDITSAKRRGLSSANLKAIGRKS